MVREGIEKKKDEKIADMAEDILTAKRILKDPNLCYYASRKFNSTFDKYDGTKLLVPGAKVTNLIEEKKDKQQNFLGCKREEQEFRRNTKNLQK